MGVSLGENRRKREKRQEGLSFRAEAGRNSLIH